MRKAMTRIAIVGACAAISFGVAAPAVHATTFTPSPITTPGPVTTSTPGPAVNAIWGPAISPGISSTMVPAPGSVPRFGCSIGLLERPADLWSLFTTSTTTPTRPTASMTAWGLSPERCGRPGPGNDDYGLGSLMWYGPDWGDPSIGTFA